MEAQLPEGWTLERVRQLAQCPTAEFLPTTVNVIPPASGDGFREFSPLRITPELIIRCNNYALVKPQGDPHWYVGQFRGVGEICLFSSGSDLSDAIRETPSAPEQPYLHARQEGPARRAEIGGWSVAVVSWSLLWALVLRAEGVGARGVGTHLLAWVAGLGMLAVATGARQAGRPWRLTLLYTALFAVSAGFVMVLVIGPDSGAAGVCSPGEACGTEEEVGLFTGPLILAVPLVVVMAVSRLLVSLGRRVVAAAATGRVNRPGESGDSSC